MTRIFIRDSKEESNTKRNMPTFEQGHPYAKLTYLSGIVT